MPKIPRLAESRAPTSTTAGGTGAATCAGEGDDPSRGSRIVRSANRLRTPGAAVAAGWLILAAGLTGALATIGDLPLSTVTYGFVWLTSTVGPGVLIWRALGGASTLVQEVGFGSVLGVGLLILAWLPATLVHHPQLIWLGPIGVLVGFGAMPRLRRHWLPRRPAERRTPRRWHFAMMAICGIAFARIYATRLLQQPLPPHPSTVFQDVWYELSLTQRLTHAVAISDPAAAGVPLNYHWFSNAHASATATLSGVPAHEVILHLWVVAMLFTFVFVTAAATERLLEGCLLGGRLGCSSAPRRWWAGPLAALLVAALPVDLFLGDRPVPEIDNGFVVSSTSGMLGLAVVLCLVGPVLDLLHGHRRPGTWALLGLLLVLSAGTKPSILPVVACGSGLVLTVEWVRTRRLPRVPMMLTLLPLCLIPLTALMVMGSTGGSRLQLFETLSLDPAFQQAAGRAVGLPGHGGWLAPGIAASPRRMWAVAGGLFGLFTLTELPRLLGVLGTASHRLRGDPGTWWCSGVVASGFSGLWVLAHPGYSQHYFWRIVIGLGVALTVANAVRLLPPHVRVGELAPDIAVVGGVGLGTGLVIAVADRDASYAVMGRLVPYGIAAAVLGALLLVLRQHSTHRWRPARMPTFATVACFCFASGLLGSLGLTAQGFPNAKVYGTSPSTQGPPSRYITADEQLAALWLQRNSAPDDVVATNVFCSPPTYAAHCSHASFWVSALTGRQLFIGAWAYTERSLSASVNGGLSYGQLGSPWPDRVSLSLTAVRAPSSAVIERLRRGGVRWIFADRRATSVDPQLRRFATLRYSNSDVLVYRLPVDGNSPHDQSGAR